MDMSPSRELMPEATKLVFRMISFTKRDVVASRKGKREKEILVKTAAIITQSLHEWISLAFYGRYFE